jgi:hypothetical protein
MDPSDKDAHDRNRETKAFDPPLIREEDIEHSATGEEEGSEEKGESPEVEENKGAEEKTNLATKEAMLKVPSGQL